jgi:hypothetical protein
LCAADCGGQFGLPRFDAQRRACVFDLLPTFAHAVGHGRRPNSLSRLHSGHSGTLVNAVPTTGLKVLQTWHGDAGCTASHVEVGLAVDRVNPAKHPVVKKNLGELARILADRVMSPRGAGTLADYKI